MKKSGKTTDITVLAAVLVVGLLALGGFVAYQMSQPGGQLAGGGGGGGVTVYTAETVNGTIDYANELNTSAATSRDVTTVCTSSSAAPIILTDTSAGSATWVKGTTYTCSPVSSGNAGGDQGKLTGIRIDNGGLATLASDGGSFSITTPMSGTFYVGMNMNVQGALKIRVVDVGGLAGTAGAYLCSTGRTSSCGTFNSTDGATFGSSTNGSAAIAIDSSGELDAKFELRATTDYENANDRGILIPIGAPVATWKDAVVTYSGTNSAGVAVSGNLADARSSLDANEQVAYDSYQYVGSIPQDVVITSSQPCYIEVKLSPKASVDPSADPTVDFQPRGTYRTTLDQNVVAVGSVTDAASPVAIHTQFSSVINIS